MTPEEKAAGAWVVALQGFRAPPRPILAAGKLPPEVAALVAAPMTTRQAREIAAVGLPGVTLYLVDLSGTAADPVRLLEELWPGVVVMATPGTLGAELRARGFA